ncbi:MAG: FAD-binding oxidoreductase [Acidobacteria bacterium]|nr:FAD-binding oxidoreductase [Acidobacteriota bacterium]
MTTTSAPPAETVAELNTSVGGPVARLATDHDAVEGVVPAAVVEPATTAQVSRILAWATERGRSVVVRGGGTKIGWAPTPVSIDLLLSTSALQGVEAHRFGDLTATVLAGTTLSATNAVLAEHGQWLALDPPGGDASTIGGIVATNDSGPRRHWHGAPRDLIIGMTLVRADGVTAHSGGIVVKNVAGYDVARLLTGSFGSLGVIVNATFKLAPRADASRTVEVDFPDTDRCAPYVAALLAQASMPTALELAFPPARMLVRFESVAAVAQQQADAAATLATAHGGRAMVLMGDDESHLWQAHAARVFEDDGDGTVLKVVMLPAEVSSTLGRIAELAAANHLDYVVTGRAGLGVLHARLSGGHVGTAEFVTSLRARFRPGQGSVVVRHADAELKSRVGVWGPIGDGLPIMREVKRRFDPTGTLGPGRGPGGL